MNSYFLTAFDPDYNIKSSRDPLGFQTIWQKTGRFIIPHISTVSSHLHDFQTLAFGLQCKTVLNMNEKDFPDFWLRLEQLMAYTRKKMGDKSILGIDRINKRWNDNSKALRISSKETIILRNQRATGVWGRYISPFNKMMIQKEVDFQTIFQEKVELLQKNLTLMKVIKKDDFKISSDSLDDFKNVFDLSKEEHDLWWKYLLKDTVKGDLLEQIQCLESSESLHGPFQTLLNRLQQAAGEDLILKLNEIKHTEFVLCPLNRIFRYLQTRSFWEKKDIERDVFIQESSAIAHIDVDFLRTAEKNKLYNMLALEDNWEKVKQIVERNKVVSEGRGGKAWLEIDDNSLEVLLQDGGHSTPYQPEEANDNYYFLSTYIGLYRELIKFKE